MASDQNKPNGQFVITPEMGPAFVESLLVGKFHGTGPATARKMNEFGIPIRQRSLARQRSPKGFTGTELQDVPGLAVEDCADALEGFEPDTLDLARLEQEHVLLGDPDPLGQFTGPHVTAGPSHYRTFRHP